MKKELFEKKTWFKSTSKFKSSNLRPQSGGKIELTIPLGKDYLTDAYTSDGDSLFKNNTGLPSGILDKKYTGIGATYTELVAERNSIIVFPFIPLAQEKAKKFNAFYIGSLKTGTVSKRSIIDYSQNDEIKYKKFCVVAESIFKLHEALGDSVYTDYHLVLDEVEMLQLQSGFRVKFPACLDEFKKFKSKTLVSATLLDFGDKALDRLDRYIINKESYVKPELTIVNTQTPHRYLSDYIKDKLHESPDRKFLIGINCIDEINVLVAHLKEKGLYDQISIICSKTSRKYLDERLDAELLDGGLLPSNITIATSILFNGVDILEEHEAIGLSFNSKIHHLMSLESFTQFSGRGRDGNTVNRTLIVNVPTKKRIVGGLEPNENLASNFKGLQNWLDMLQYKVSSYRLRREILDCINTSDNHLVSKIIYQKTDGSLSTNYLFHDLLKHESKVFEYYSQGIERIKSVFDERFSCKVLKHHHFESDLSIDPNTDLDNYIDRISKSKLWAEYAYENLQDPKTPVKLRAASQLYILGVAIRGENELNDFLTSIRKSALAKGISFENYVLALTYAFYLYSSDYYEQIKTSLQALADSQNRVNGSDIWKVFKAILPSSLNVPYFHKGDAGPKNYLSLLIYELAFGQRLGKSGTSKYSLDWRKSEILNYHPLLESKLKNRRPSEMIKRNSVSKGLGFDPFGLIVFEEGRKSINALDVFCNASYIN